MLFKRLTTLLLSSFLIIFFPGTALAKDLSYGKAQYLDACAVCHGVKGSGDGPVAEALLVDTPALTTLSKNNGGVFPYEMVYQTIDGRGDIEAHGPREMPIWGKKFTAETDEIHGPIWGEWFGEDIAKARILSLINYIHSLQAK